MTKFWKKETLATAGIGVAACLPCVAIAAGVSLAAFSGVAAVTISVLVSPVAGAVLALTTLGAATVVAWRKRPNRRCWPVVPQPHR